MAADTHLEYGLQGTPYSDALKKLAEFGTVEEFWTVYNHIMRPSDLHDVTLSLFKAGIPPMWEVRQVCNRFTVDESVCTERL